MQGGMADRSDDIWGVETPSCIRGHTAKAATSDISGFRATINSQILACVPQGDVAVATEWSQRMVDFGLQPDDLTIAAMARCA